MVLETLVSQVSATSLVFCNVLMRSLKNKYYTWLLSMKCPEYFAFLWIQDQFSEDTFSYNSFYLFFETLKQYTWDILYPHHKNLSSFNYSWAQGLTQNAVEISVLLHWRERISSLQVAINCVQLFVLSWDLVSLYPPADEIFVLPVLVRVCACCHILCKLTARCKYKLTKNIYDLNFLFPWRPLPILAAIVFLHHFFYIEPWALTGWMSHRNLM